MIEHYGFHEAAEVVTRLFPNYDGFMNNTYTAIIQQDGDWWIGWIEEVPNALAQERTRQELIESLKEVLSIMLEVNREQARKMAIPGYEEVRISA